MRMLDGTAALSVLAAFILALWSVSREEPIADVRSAYWLNDMEMHLSRADLIRRDDVMIEVNDIEVARGYSSPVCDGLLLVAHLPYTAQSWAHIAPHIDLSRYSIRYVTGTEVSASAPTLQRLGRWLVGTLPGVAESRRPTVALAEVGHCSLLETAIPAVVASRGLNSRTGVTS